MKLTYTLLAVALVVVNAGADETSSNTRHNLNNRPYGSGGRPVHGQVGVGQFGTLGGRPVQGQVGVGQFGTLGGKPVQGQVGVGQFGTLGGRPVQGQVGVGQFGTLGGRPVQGQVGVGQFGTLGGRPVAGQIGSGQFGGFPQGVSPPLIAAPQRPDCKFFKRGPYGNYICDVDQKPFECPLVRFECPRFGVPIGPQKCYNDNDCYGNDKCCRDACFNHLICKGPE